MTRIIITHGNDVLIKSEISKIFHETVKEVKNDLDFMILNKLSSKESFFPQPKKKAQWKSELNKVNLNRWGRK